MRHENTSLICELQNLPAPAPKAGFEQRVLGKATEQFDSSAPVGRFGTAISAAAALFIAILVAQPFQSTSLDPLVDQAGDQIALTAADPSAAVSDSRTVNILLTSAQSLQNALLTVQLDGNLALENYPNVQLLSWETNLKPGNNRLTLPVRQLDSRSGEIVVTLRHGDFHQQLAIHINGV